MEPVGSWLNKPVEKSTFLSLELEQARVKITKFVHYAFANEKDINYTDQNDISQELFDLKKLFDGFTICYPTPRLGARGEIGVKLQT